jgi:hypothetical protein
MNSEEDCAQKIKGLSSEQLDEERDRLHAILQDNPQDAVVERQMSIAVHEHNERAWVSLDFDD